MVKHIVAFLKLVRWPNLVFVALTQILFHYCIIQPLFASSGITPIISGIYFWLITVAYIFIAAAGYIINDYFDLNIDRINKPDKVIVTKFVSRRWAILWHSLLSLLALAMCFWVDQSTHLIILTPLALAMILLLFFYSVSLKKKLLIGNVLIAAIIAWGIAMFALYEFQGLYQRRLIGFSGINHRLLRYTYMYAGFAFIITIIREVVKDMEDVEGDRRYGCKTMPIVWGIPASKVFVSVWMIVLLGILALTVIYVVQYAWWHLIVFDMVFLIYPLIKVFKMLFTATTPVQFGAISSTIKKIMFAGIASMLFWRWLL